MSRSSALPASLARPFHAIARWLLEACRAHYGDKLVSLAIFGSVARGTATPESDIDILIVARDLARGRLNRMADFQAIEESVLRKADGRQHIELSPIIKSPEEVSLGSPLFWDMTEDVIILADRDGFMRDFLAGVKRKLETLGARRVRQGSAWYWILKADYRPGEVFEI